MKTADQLRASFIRANRGRLTMTPGQYDSWLKRVVAEDRLRRGGGHLVDATAALMAEALDTMTRNLARAENVHIELVGGPERPTWDRWRVPVPAGRGMSSDLVIVDEVTGWGEL